MKVLPTGVLYINKNNVENEEKDSLSSNNIKTESGGNNNNEYEGEQGKFYRSISCCLTMLICFSIVISILFITVVWVSTFSASLITLADSNRRNEFNKLENYFRQTLKDIENFGETASGVLSKELQYYDLKKTEDLMFSLWKAQYLNTNGLEYFIFVVDADGIALGFSRPETPGSYGDDVFTTMVLLHPNISGPNHFYMYVCKDFFNKNYCDRGPLKSPDIVVDSSGNNVILYQMAIPYIGQKIWTPLYSDAATPGLLHMNMLYAFNTTYVNNGKDNAVFGYDFAATSMGIYLNESTLHLPGAVVFVIETPTGQIVASNDVMTSTCNVCIEVKYSQNLQKTSDFVYSNFNQKLTNLKCNYQYSLSFENRYVNVMRICTENGIDWVLILSVEQWYYIGNIVIAIIAAVVASIIIIIIGIFISIYFSSRIVTPFKQLIILFSLVSNMELEDITIPKSFFSEAEFIMYMFNQMVSRMKLYRSFIPSFLLTELEDQMLKGNNNGKTVEPPVARNPNNYVTEKNQQNMKSRATLFSMDSSRSLSRQASSLGHSSHRMSSNLSFLQKFELGLEIKDVTIVGLRLVNFGTWMVSVDTTEIVSMTSLIFQTVQQLAKSGKGQVGSFENGFITISFNAAIKSDNHGLKGCKTATSLTEKLPRLTEEKTKGPLPFIIHCAVVTDSVACGNLGTSEVKSFSIIGNIQKKMQEMLTKNLELDIPITISGKVQKVIKEQFTTRPIETISFCNNQCQLQNINVFELGEVLHVAMDEWMYEMEQKESKNKWNNYNEGYNLYMDGKYGDASQKFKEHLLRNPNDKVGKKMLDICQ